MKTSSKCCPKGIPNDLAILWQKWGAIGTCASALVAIIAVAVNIWQASEAHREKRYARIAKETLEVEQARMDALQGTVAIQETALSNALTKVQLYDDILASGGGDRFAYLRVTANLWADINSGSPTAERSRVLERMLKYVTERFLESATNNDYIAFHAIKIPPPLFDRSNVRVNLKSKNLIKRLNALGTIWSFRLNEYIPAVVEMLEAEPDLNVVQFAVLLIEETFADNMSPNDSAPIYSLSLDDCVFRYEEFKRHFTEMWNPAKARILARKPKEVREGRDRNPPHLPMVYLFDPEKPEDIPVLKE